MPVGVTNCNGPVKLEESSRGGATTRNKRKRASSSPDAIQVDMPSHKERIMDIGWDHGKVIDGNRFHWKCNWCGLVRYGGGVSRLKQHLAGVPNVKHCPKVPNHIAKEILNHLKEKKSVAIYYNKGRKKNHSRRGDLVDKIPRIGDMEVQSGRSNQLSREAAQQSRTAFQQPKITTQQSTATTGLTGLTKGVKKHHEISCPSTIKEDRHSRREDHWKYVLDTILQFPDVGEGGGISCCIHDALRYGPEYTTKFKMRDTAQLKEKFVYDSAVKCHQTSQGATNVKMNVSKTGSLIQTDTNINNIKCQNVFLDILRSENFALLCDLVCKNFQDDKVKLFFDFSLINSKMKNGAYDQLPGLFNQDIREVWDKCHKFGQEMVLLATNLSSMSQASCQKQETCQVVAKRKSFVESTNATTQFTSHESGWSTNPDQAEASVLYKVLTCKQCGKGAKGECSLVCSECQAMYHISCINHTLAEIPTQNWYCIACSAYKKESPEPFLAHSKKHSVHKNHLISDGLKASGTQEDCNDNDSRILRASNSIESSVSFMETDEPLQPSRTAKSCLCKICGVCEGKDKKFLICSHVHCPYKFYHIRCLKGSQIARPQQQKKSCWYCPSCLCRACLSDKDDERIVLCDGCDEAYHTYCMKPPRASIPKGQWYCLSCNASGEREGMKRYKKSILQQGRKNDDRQFTEVSGAVNLLLIAAEELRSEEQLMSGRQ